MNGARPAASRRRALHKRGCLFCLRKDGGFSSREHVFSEALGNHEHVLDAGIVCDRCNNGPLGRADEALVNFPPISLLRAERGLPTKSGRAVLSKWGNAKIAFSRPGTLDVYGGSSKIVTTSRGTSPGRQIRALRLTTGGPITEKRIGLMVRSVWKATLECIYLAQGPEVAFDPLFDSARRAIVVDGNARGWAVMPTNNAASPSVTLKHHPQLIGGVPAVPVLMNVFGVVLHTDLLRRNLVGQSITTPWPANVWVFGSADAT
jgi:hypothetical protein